MAMVPESGYRGLDPDTILSPGSGEASLRATGALVEAVDAVFAGEAKNAFCAVRPPGHHAEPNRAMGFCLFNNVAVGAARALAADGRAPDPTQLPNGGSVLDRVYWIEDFPPGSRSLAEEVATGLSCAPALVLAAHGAVTIGATVEQAVLRMIRLERLALVTRGR